MAKCVFHGQRTSRMAKFFNICHEMADLQPWQWLSTSNVTLLPWQVNSVGTGVSLINVKLLPSTAANIRFLRYNRTMRSQVSQRESAVGLPDYLKFFQGCFVFKQIWWTSFMGVRRGAKRVFAPLVIGSRTKKCLKIWSQHLDSD